MPQVPPDIPLQWRPADARPGVRTLFLMHHSGGVEYPAAQISCHAAFRSSYEDDLRDLGMHAERQSPLETFIQRRDAAAESQPRQATGSGAATAAAHKDTIDALII